MKVEELKKVGRKDKPSFRNLVFETLTTNEAKTLKDICGTFKIETNSKQAKKVRSSLSNLVRDKKIERRYFKNEAYYFVI